MNKAELIKSTATQLIQEGNMEIVSEVFSEDYVAHAGDKAYKGQKFIIDFTRQVRNAIPNIKIKDITILSQCDSTITWQRSFSGVHKGNLRGIPASMKKIKWYEIVVSRFENDKIVEEWVSSDLAAQLLIKQSK